jgi:ribonuclease HI
MVSEEEKAQSGPALTNGETSSVIPEMFAMIAMLKKITNNEKYAQERHIIYTDSAQTLQLALGLNSWHHGQEGHDIVETLREMVEIAEQKLDITIKWCKGHNGNVGNEIADKAATSQVKHMKKTISDDMQRASQMQPTERKHDTPKETETAEQKAKRQRIIQVEDEMENEQEWAEMDCNSREVLAYLYAKMGGRQIGKDALADKVWALGILLPHMADDRAKLMLESAVAAIRQGCGKYDAIQKTDIAQVAKWILKNEEEATARVQQRRAKEEEKVRQATTKATEPANQNHKDERTEFWQKWSAKKMVKKKIYPISLCAGGGNPELALMRAVRRLRKYGYDLDISPGERYETDQEANAVARTLLKGTVFEGAIEMGSIVNFPARAKRLKAKEDTIILVLGGTPCTKLIGLVKRWDANARVGPHMDPSNLMFLAHEGIQTIQKENEGRVMVVMEQVIPAFQHWEDEIKARMGSAKRASTNKYRGQATRDRLFMKSHYNAELEEWEGPFEEEGEITNTKGNGFFWQTNEQWQRWPHSYSCMENKPPTMKAYYPVLVMRQGNKGDYDAPVEWERVFLNKMRIHDARSDGLYAGAEEVMTWMGLTQHEIRQIQDDHRCEKRIDRLQGLPESYWNNKPNGPTQNDYTLCGGKRFCVPCANILRVMGNAWNIKTATDEIMKVIISMQNGDRAFDYKKVLVHKCGIKCPLIETVYDARKKEELRNQKRSQAEKYIEV